MKNDINILLKADTEYKEKSAKITEWELQLAEFQKSIQYNLEKKSKLPAKIGVPKNDEEIAAMDREIRELRRSISALHFWDNKEKRRLRSLLAEKESSFRVDYNTYYVHEQWKNIEKDLAYFTQCAENYKCAIAESRTDLEGISKTRATALANLKQKISGASAETLKTVFGNSQYATLPAPIPAMVINKCKSNLWPTLPVSMQVKLLYPYDTTISFGGYTWNVLEVQKDKALLLMNRLWCSGEFCRSNTKTPTWENSSARASLNGTFLNALKAKNQGELCPDENGDYVFLLSKSEAEIYLDYGQLAVDGASWWLRDISNYDTFSIASCVDGFRQFGTQYPNYEKDNHGDKLGYRPAVWVKLNSGDVENWENNHFPISCKGRWRTKSQYDGISVSLDRVIERMREYGQTPTTNPDPLGYRDGVHVDGRGI